MYAPFFVVGVRMKNTNEKVVGQKPGDEMKVEENDK